MSMNSRFSSDGRKSRLVRRKFDDTAGLSITSLLDVLTIILVFLIKNVSMEAQKVTIPTDMRFPSTITNEQLIAQGSTMVVRMYPDQIYLGTESLSFGSLAEIVDNASKREAIYNYLSMEAQKIFERPANNEPCLLIQADETIPCQYISEMVKIGTQASFQFVYFSTLSDPTWFSGGVASLR